MIESPNISGTVWAPSRKAPGILLVSIVALLALVVAGAWFGVRHFNSASSSPVAASAVAVSEDGLKTMAGALDRPLYWAGSRNSVKYELTVAPNGRTYVRYLPKGVAVGTKAKYLTVGTYAFSNAFAVTKAAAHAKSSVAVAAPDGAIAFYRKTTPTSVFVAFPGSSEQIEVYDPSAAKARHLVESGLIGKIVPTSNSTPALGTAIVSSSASLKALAAKLHAPIYTAGQISGTSHELTRTPDGRIYVRYLPAGVAPGSATPYLTVATYPVKNAYATTEAAMKRGDVVKVPMSGGAGIAFYLKSHPTSVYVAFPGVNEQIEVFDPSASQARQLVTSRQIQPVS
jgi:hypothetical protein